MKYLGRVIQIYDRICSVEHEGNIYAFDTLTEAKEFCKELFEKECAKCIRR